MSQEPHKGGHPTQEEMPFAVVQGRAVTQLPKDLYIPPDALEVFLEAFEGPLDLLLYFIRRQNLDILEIDVAAITDQYIRYIESMNAMRFELAAEYLVMAAMLAEIKSRMLLPRQTESSEDEDDPRAALIMRLLEYERYKEAAESLDQIPRMGRDLYALSMAIPEMSSVPSYPQVDLRELLVALSEVLHRADMFRSHSVSFEPLSTRERMSQILERVRSHGTQPFSALFRLEEGKMGVCVTFLAILELVRESLLDLTQSEAFGMIHVRAREN
jgi:segregation and condensation protein A